MAFAIFSGQLRRLRKVEDGGAKCRWLSKEDGRGGGALSTEHQASTSTQATFMETCGDGYEECGAIFQKNEKGRR